MYCKICGCHRGVHHRCDMSVLRVRDSRPRKRDIRVQAAPDTFLQAETDETPTYGQRLADGFAMAAMAE